MITLAGQKPQGRLCNAALGAAGSGARAGETAAARPLRTSGVSETNVAKATRGG